MSPGTRTSLALLVVLAIGFSACSRKDREQKKEYQVLGEFVNAQDSLPRIRFFDGQQISLNDRCPVRKGKLNVKMTPVYVNGQPVGFCGSPCAAAFVQGPEQYLRGLGISIACAVDPARPAILDTAHRALVNHEVYFFADEDALRTFVATPYRFTGKVTDPVTLQRFVPTEASPTRSHGGRLFYFAAGANAAKFDSDPATYGIPRPMMKVKT
jgi:YHS domain-containing protein